MDAVLSVLAGSELFEGVPREALAALVPLGSLRSFPKGSFLLEPRQEISHLGLLLSGKVHLLHLFPGGDYSLMSALGPGDMVGAELVCTHSRLSPYHALAAEDSRLFRLEESLITRPGVLEEGLRLKLLGNLLTLISQENMRREYRLAILSRNGLRERILMYLTMQRSRLGRNPFTVTLNREEMAAFLCVNRSALSHELSKMQHEGLLTFRKNQFSLPER